MFCGIASHADEPMPRIYDAFVNRDTMCTMHQETEAKYIGEHFGNDWKLMVDILSTNVEDLAAGMHELLRKMGSEPRDEPKGQAGGDLNWEKMNLEGRNKWEETTESKYLGKMVKDFDTQLQDLFKKWGGAEEDGKFVAELTEQADLRSFPKEKRESEMPQLWAYRTPVTLDSLHARMGVLRNAQETLPVLTTVLQRPLFSVLPSLGCMVGVFQWHSLVLNRFSGRITRAQAEGMTVAKVLDSIQNPTERAAWERAYAQFEKAWHIAWPHIERHECQDIPEGLKKVRIDQNSSMSLCIVDPENEGICPLALTQWLVARHNELVQVVSAAIAKPNRTEREAQQRHVPPVSSRLLSEHDVVKYDEQALMRFLQSRCVTYAVGGRLNFDFKQLEQQLRRELARPEITMEMAAFQWLGQASLQLELKAVIPQKDLLPDIVDRIKAEINSPSLANLCLQKVQMATSFIMKSGSISGEHAGEARLSEYLSSVLAESADSIPSTSARREVQLWHLSAFEKLLKQVINCDPTDNIDPKYRVELPKELLDLLMAKRDLLPASLADDLGSFAESQLRSTVLNDKESMITTLEYVVDTDDVEKWGAIKEHLPPAIQLMHWRAVYW